MSTAKLVAISSAEDVITSVVVAQLSEEYCHFNMDPVAPLRVSVVLLIPVQTAVLLVRVPPDAATVTWITFDAAASVHVALQLTLARRLNQVVVVKAPAL